MNLSNDLISQFVKATKDDNKTKKENTVYGTIVEYQNEKYVKLDGSELLTPISSTTNADDGERVTVMIKNHTATVTGNISAPSAKNSDVTQLGNKISEFEIVIADKVSTIEFDAEKARIDDLVADNVTIKDSLTSTEASIKDLTADNVTINQKLTANEASIKELETQKLDAEMADLTYATIEELNATNADIYNLNATYAEFEKTTTNELDAINGSITNLQTNKLDARYANIEFTNITEASIENLFVKSGMIKDLVMSSGAVTGELVGVTIKGDLIEANSIVADKLVVLGNDGLYYKLNTNGSSIETEQTNYNSINGSIITAKSITATKINVDDLNAFGATIGGFKITDDSIYSGVKTSVDNTTRGIYFDTDGQMVFGDSTNYIKFYKDTTDSQYKLNIAVNNLLIGSAGKNVEMIMDDLSNEIDTVDESVDSRIDVTKTDLTNELNSLSNSISTVANNSKEYTDTAIQDCAKTSDLESINESVDDRINTAKNDVLNTVSNNYVVVSEVENIYQTVQSMIEKSDTEITFTFEGITSSIRNEIVVNQENFEKYIRFSESGIELGEIDSPFKTNITNTEIYFSQGGNKIAYISNSKLYILEAEFINKMSIGNDDVGYYDWVIRKNKHLSLKLRGGVS